MKKSIKLVSALLAATAMAFSAAGCSSQTESTSTPPQAPAETNDNTSTDPSADAADSETKEGNYQIGIIQLVEHDALDSARNGFIDALAEAGYKDGENLTIDFQNAQNDQSNLKTISQRFVNNKMDLILAIATPAAQTVAAETSDIPILGTAITDYVEASLVESNEAPGHNVSGTSDRTPVQEQFDLMKRILPDVQKVGILYNSSEVNSEIQANLAIDAATTLGIEYETATVANVNDIPQVVQSLVNKVDALYIPTDNTFASAMPVVCSVSDEAKLPVIVGENGMCKGGGLATVGIDYHKLGQQTGAMAVKVLEGQDISAMPVEFTEIADVCINLDAAATLGITIPDDILEEAVIIIENGEVRQ